MVMSMPVIVNCKHSLAVRFSPSLVREETVCPRRPRHMRNSMAVTGEESEAGSAAQLAAWKPPKSNSGLHPGEEEASGHSSKGDASQKKELRLLKNREAARVCRRKKKEYVKCLENRVAVLENQNKALIEELRAMKDLHQVKVG